MSNETNQMRALRAAAGSPERCVPEHRSPPPAPLPPAAYTRSPKSEFAPMALAPAGELYEGGGGIPPHVRRGSR